MRSPEIWPFDDPRNLATFTVDEVLSGAKPILHVSHDVSDGGWQFLTGEPVELEHAKLVCLADVVELDPSLAEIADLRLGWSAHRESVAAPWQRTPAFPTEWTELVREAHAYAEAQQERMIREHSLLDWERFDYQQEGAVLTFSGASATRLVVDIQLVGSVSTKSGTWLWAWDNATILDEAAESVHVLRKYGAQHGFEKLSTAKWPADEVDGWEMAVVACLLLGGEGVYRVPGQDGFLFMVLTNPQLLALS